MKTSKSDYHKIKNIIIVMSLSYAALFMSGCNKEEAMQPSSKSYDDRDLKQSDPAGAPFSFIKIDHYAASTQLPEYTVIVHGNGQVIFEGKKNVKVIDRVEYNISSKTVNDLGELFFHSNFMTMTHESLWSPDLPINATTFAINRGALGPKTLHDDNLNPVELVSLRNKVESLLNISKFIIKGQLHSEIMPDIKDN